MSDGAVVALDIGILLRLSGLVVDGCDYAYRCMIVPPEEIVPDVAVIDWNRQFPSLIL